MPGRTVREYRIDVFYSEEDHAWVADIPDLDACSALGATAGQALAELEKASDLWLASARDAGKPVPTPRYRPAIYQTLFSTLPLSNTLPEF